MNEETLLHLIFYFFTATAIGSAVAVITVRSSVHSALSLVVTFFSMAAIWMLLRAEFLSLILLLVYVGAVMTLFLFVVMMLKVDKQIQRSGFVNYLPFGVFISLVLAGLLISAVGPHYFGLTQMPVPKPEEANYSNTAQLGAILYTDFAYPFEIAGVILLTAIIAAITLAHRGPVRRRVQFASAQVAVQPEDRLRLIKMTAEPKQET